MRRDLTLDKLVLSRLNPQYLVFNVRLF